MLNSWKSAGVIFTAAKSLLNGTPNLYIQQTRNTMILKRKFPLPLHKKGAKPRRLNHRDYIYELVEDTCTRKQEPIEVILTQFVQGYGEKGEKVNVKPHKAYNELLLPGLAVYASPENIEKYLVTDRQEKTYSSINAPILINLLKRCLLPVNMSVENPWILEKWHIRANFRRIGVIVPEEAITLSDKEITGPNLDNEGKEFYVTVTINNTEQTMVRCRLHHDTYDISKQLYVEPNYWKIPGEAIFPEDQEILDSIPRPKFEDK